MLQMSQADLLQQFYLLQDNFSNLLQGFEESKKVQLQQQIIIRQLAERQGLSHHDLLQGNLLLESVRESLEPDAK
jgi:thiamine kinase-like enzyme